MKRVMLIVAIVFAVIAGSAGAQESLMAEAGKAMQTSSAFLRSIATNGGYVGIYSPDLKQRYGEAVYEKAAENEIWVQPPGTPSIGMCFLRAYRITGDDMYLRAAREVGRALAWGQRKEGGWDHRVDVSHMKSDPAMPERNSGRCTLDDDISQGAMTFLIELDSELDEKWLTGSIELALRFMQDSQFENGAWPQWYPLIGGYHDYYTYNDNTINDCIAMMVKAHRVYGRDAYIGSARLGGDFIVMSQLPPPQTGWAQQYSHDMKPAWARAFEPPAVCSAVTARNIRTLVDLYLYTKDKKYLEPIPAAITWLENSKLDDDLWARMYEVGTNKPIYGDRDKKIHYTLEEISEERRNGYSWQSGFGVRSAVAYYNEVKNTDPEAYVITKSKPETLEQRKQRHKELAPRVREYISSLDGSGRWIDKETNLIYARDFVRNFNILCDYLETAK